MVCCSGLYVMTFFTRRLPVGFVPEEVIIAAVRDDVIDEDSCPDDLWRFLGTQSAERILGEVKLAGPAPSGIISPLSCRATVFIILAGYLLFMGFAITAFTKG